MQQFPQMNTEELVVSEFNHLKYYLASNIYNEFQPLLKQILLVKNLLEDSNHKSKLTHLEQLQHLQTIRENVDKMVLYIDSFLYE